jgi:plastocyanin
MRGRLAGALFLLAALALLAAACGTGPTASGAPAAAPAASAAAPGAVRIQDFAFQPGVVKVATGSKVTWTGPTVTARPTP